uniref:Uncharacterized protein n=1 Tax=Vespula pensylvanica TaxID=30213 RepID=A0A834JX20_VESPE|nr:hypothetical protein H0235_017079 [Vespula pensylvanica]
MTRKYSVKSKSYRWPVQVFFFKILDLTAEELIEEYHKYLREEKENLQGTSNSQGNIFPFAENMPDAIVQTKQLNFV